MNEWEISIMLGFAICSLTVSGNSPGGLMTCRAVYDHLGVSCFQRIHWAEFFYMIISLFVPFLPLNIVGCHVKIIDSTYQLHMFSVPLRSI